MTVFYCASFIPLSFLSYSKFILLLLFKVKCLGKFEFYTNVNYFKF